MKYVKVTPIHINKSKVRSIGTRISRKYLEEIEKFVKYVYIPVLKSYMPEDTGSLKESVRYVYSKKGKFKGISVLVGNKHVIVPNRSKYNGGKRQGSLHYIDYQTIAEYSKYIGYNPEREKPEHFTYKTNKQLQYNIRKLYREIKKDIESKSKRKR